MKRQRLHSDEPTLANLVSSKKECIDKESRQAWRGRSKGRCGGGRSLDRDGGGGARARVEGGGVRAGVARGGV